MGHWNEIEMLFIKSPRELLDYMLRGPLTNLFKERLKSNVTGWLLYSNHLIGKIAIHSSTFYFLSDGIIEQKKSGEQIKLKGCDLFTINTTFRAMLESYATFHNIYIEPNNEAEQKFRFLLWKIDGLHEKKRFDIKNDDFEGVEEILSKDNDSLEKTISDFMNCDFYKSLPETQLKKIYDPDKMKYNWRFKIVNDEIIPLNITKLITHVYRRRGFINAYRYASIHTHSNYYAIEEFAKIKGKLVDDDKIVPLERLALLIIMRLIEDLANMDSHAKMAYANLDSEMRNFIEGMNHVEAPKNNN